MKTILWNISVFVLLAASAACSKKSEGPGAAGEDLSNGLASRVASSQEVTARGKELGQLVDLIVAGAADLPRAEFDPAALSAKLGKDPQTHFVWVRDNTFWAPYRGLLRGSRGVMLDRVGSSLDRAVLLGDLLRRSGYTVRLAHARLPEARARELVAKMRPIPDQRRGRIETDRPTSQRQREIEAVMPGYQAAAQQREEKSRQIVEEANALVRSQVNMLQAKAREFAAESKVDDEATVSALREHWWVEREDKGKWIAMDVTLPDSREGEALAAATGRSNWGSADDSPSIPDTEWHSVQVRVVVESYENGKVTENTALETVIRPANALDRPITFGHMPMQWPEDLPDPKVDPNALGNAAVNVREWVPYLKIGQEFVAQSAFDQAGNIITDVLSSQKDINEVGGGSLFGGFDDALSGGAAGESSQLTAEWIDYEIRVPGEANQQLRRPVFDLLGPTQRSAKVADFDATTNEGLVERSEALLSSTDILLQPCEFTAEFISHLNTASVVAEQKGLLQLSREPDPAIAKDLAVKILERLDIWSPLPDLARLRTQIGRQAGDWFVDRPNILNYRISPPVVNADTQALQEMIDFAANGIGVRPRSGRTSFDVRMHQGVADTVAEAVALGADLRQTANAASILRLNGATADRTILIRPRSADGVSELGWPEDVAARLADNIEDGYAAVVPIEPVSVDERQRVGWWRVDPASGETIGVMDSGFHGVDEDAALRAALAPLRVRLVDARNRLSMARVMRLRRGEFVGEDELFRLVSHLLNDLNRYLTYL